MNIPDAGQLDRMVGTVVSVISSKNAGLHVPTSYCKQQGQRLSLNETPSCPEYRRIKTTMLAFKTSFEHAWGMTNHVNRLFQVDF